MDMGRLLRMVGSSEAYWEEGLGAGKLAFAKTEPNPSMSQCRVSMGNSETRGGGLKFMGTTCYWHTLSKIGLDLKRMTQLAKILAQCSERRTLLNHTCACPSRGLENMVLPPWSKHANAQTEF